MNSETFAQYLKTPAYLYRVSYEELKSLVVQYPYCQNLRFLLLKKSQADQHPDYERNLQMAATYSIDRNWLYEQLYTIENADISVDDVDTNKEVLELKDLEATAKEPEKEILYANKEEESSEPIQRDFSKIDLSEPREEEEMFAVGDKSSDEIPQNTAALVEEINNTSESEVEEVEDLLDEVLAEAEGHQITELAEEKEDFENIISLELPSQEEEKHLLDETGVAEEEITDAEIAELFDEEEELIPSENQNEEESPTFLEDTDWEKLEDNVDTDQTLPSTAVSLASISVGADNQDKDDNRSLDFELNKEGILDISDLSPVGVNNTNEEEEIFEIETKKVSPQSSFSNWLKQFESSQISIEIEDLNTTEKGKVNYKYELINGEWQQIKIKPKKKKKKGSAEQIAARSVKLSGDIASETLAQLLEKQQYYAKAIKMYRQLSLENPQKSEFFAAKIEKLKKLIDA